MPRRKIPLKHRLRAIFRVPAEIWSEIASYLDNKSLHAATLTNITMRRLFMRHMFKGVIFSDTQDRLDSELRAFIATAENGGSSASRGQGLNNFVRNVCIILEPCLPYEPKSDRWIALSITRKKMRPDLSLSSVILGAVFNITLLDRLDLCLKALNIKQESHMVELLSHYDQPRWNLRHLKLIGSSNVAIAFLKISKKLTSFQYCLCLHDPYDLLQKLIETQPKLQRLHLTVRGPLFRRSKSPSMDIELVNIILQRLRSLRWLVLGEPEGYYSPDEEKGLQQFNTNLVQLEQLLKNYDSLERFAFTLYGYPIRKFLTVEGVNWRELPVNYHQALIDEWYTRPIRQIGNAVPRLEKISIISDPPTIYSGSRKATGEITKVAKKRMSQGTKDFPCSVQE